MIASELITEGHKNTTIDWPSAKAPAPKSGYGKSAAPHYVATTHRIGEFGAAILRVKKAAFNLPF